MLFNLIELGHQRGSTAITTNLNSDDWYTFPGHKEMVAASSIACATGTPRSASTDPRSVPECRH